MKQADPEKRDRPGVRTKIYVRDDMIGGGKVDLLRLVAETGSMTAACERLSMSHKRAQFLLETLQACVRRPLYEVSASGTRVTDFGREFLARHAAHEAAVARASAPFIAWLTDEQAD